MEAGFNLEETLGWDAHTTTSDVVNDKPFRRHGVVVCLWNERCFNTALRINGWGHHISIDEVYVRPPLKFYFHH